VQLRSNYRLVFYIAKRYNPPQLIPITVTFWRSSAGVWEQNVGIGFAAPTEYQPSPTAVRYLVFVRVNWNSARARDGIEELREEGVEQFYFAAGLSDVQLPPEWQSKVYVPPGGISHSHWAIVTFAVVPPNQPPVAVASADPTVVAVGQPIQFSGEGSSDPDGDPLTYYWDFKDGGWSIDKNTTHTYTQPDTYKVTLTVSDPLSESDTAEVEVMAVGASFDRDPVLVGVAKIKTVTAAISPSAGYGYVSFSTADPAVATVEPATADGPIQELRISGLKKGVTTLDARVNGEICGSLTIKVGHIDFVRITPNPGYLVPGERTTFTAIGFAAVQGYPALPRGYAPDLATSLGAEVRFVTPQGAGTRGVYLGPVKGRWKLEGGPNAEAFIPPDVPSENVSTVAVEAAPHAAGDISPDLFFYLANGDGASAKLGAPGVQFLKFGTGQVITKVVTGYSVPANKSTLAKKITVSVNPAKDAVNVKFTVTGQNRVRINVLRNKKDLAKGLLTVEILGRSATPANKPNGDTVLQAKLGAKAFTLNVVVAVPKHHSHVVAGKSEHVNDLYLDPYGDGKNYLGTYHFRRVAISVSDQFNKALDSVYDRTRLEERFDNIAGDPKAFPKVAIGKWAVMTAVPVAMTNGKFDDPVGTTSLDRTNPDPTKPEIRKWLKGPPPQVDITTTRKGSADMKLRIAGHQLDEVSRRQVQIAPKDTVNVTDKQNP